MKLYIRHSVVASLLLDPSVAPINARPMATPDTLTKAFLHQPLVTAPPAIPKNDFLPFVNNPNGTFSTTFRTPGLRLYKDGVAIPYSVLNVRVTDGWRTDYWNDTTSIKRFELSGFWSRKGGDNTVSANVFGVTGWSQNPFAKAPSWPLPVPNNLVLLQAGETATASYYNAALLQMANWPQARSTSFQLAVPDNNNIVTALGVTYPLIQAWNPWGTNGNWVANLDWTDHSLLTTSSFCVWYELSIDDAYIANTAANVDDLFLVFPLPGNATSAYWDGTGTNSMAEYPLPSSGKHGSYAAFVAGLSGINPSRSGASTMRYDHGQLNLTNVIYGGGPAPSGYEAQVAASVVVSSTPINQIELLNDKIVNTFAPPPTKSPY